MATLTPTTSAVFIPEVWAKESILSRRNKLVAANLVNTQYESDLTNGDIVHIPYVANMTAGAVTAGTDLVPVAPTETEILVTVDKMDGLAVTLHDWTKKQSKYDLAKIYGGQIGEALARSIDSAVLTELRTLTNSSAVGSANTAINTGAATAVTFANFVDALAALDEKNVPQEGRSIVIHPRVMADLRKISQFNEYQMTGVQNPSVASDTNGGFVGSIYGVPVYMTTQVPTVAGTPAVWPCFIFQKDAVALVVQKGVNLETDRRALALSTDVVGSCLYGVKAVRKDHVVLINRGQ